VKVTDFLSQKPIKMYIGGQWVESADGGTFQTLDPGDGSVLAMVAEGKAEDINKAVAAATEAFEKSDLTKKQPASYRTYITAGTANMRQ